MLPATIEQESLQVKRLLGGGLRSTTPVRTLATMGIKIDPLPDAEEEASLVSYQPAEGEGERLLAVFENFRVISRYNFSTNYVLAVTELAERITNALISPSPLRGEDQVRGMK
jgi:membrane-bound lytic murein transglycosylase B